MLTYFFIYFRRSKALQSFCFLLYIVMPSLNKISYLFRSDLFNGGFSSRINWALFISSASVYFCLNSVFGMFWNKNASLKYRSSDESLVPIFSRWKSVKMSFVMQLSKHWNLIEHTSQRLLPSYVLYILKFFSIMAINWCQITLPRPTFQKAGIFYRDFVPKLPYACHFQSLKGTIKSLCRHIMNTNNFENENYP